MKSDVALDHAVFQLTPSRNRCELVVVCGEETERLASGLLKPFLVHVKAAEDQYATGTKEIKLKPPPGYGYVSKPETSAWFTKGTIERFVRFVSTPEVLERVGTVEAELVQLEGAIKEHTIETTKIDASQSSVAAGAPPAAGSILLTATTDQAPTPTPSRRNSLDETENPAPDDNARRRLLRAMEARKMLLHKEQSMAFARATAAGFDMQKMEHLLVFADCFGANRLGDACVMYTSIFKKSKESGLWDENEWPLSDTTSLRNVPTSPELRPRESDLWSDMHSEAGDFRLDELRDDVSVRSYTNYYSEDLSLRAYSGGEILRKWSPLEGMLSPSRTRDFNGELSRSRGGSKQTSWDEGSRIAQSREGASRPYADDSFLYPHGSSRRLPSLGSQHPGIIYSGDNTNELGTDLDSTNRGSLGQRQRRAWGPPPQFLAHQISVGLKTKSGPLLPGSDSYHMAVQGTPNTSNGLSASSHRIGESLPSWAAAAGQSDQPWHPGSTAPTGHGLPRLMVPKFQAHVVAGNGHLQSTLSAEPVIKPPEANGNVLSSPAANWQEHKRRQRVEGQEAVGSATPASVAANGNKLATARDLKSRPGAGRTTDRPQNKHVVRRASSPRRRSSSPMRRVQVGRNTMRRSGVMIAKGVNYASTKPAGSSQITPKELEPSDEETDDAPGEQNGSLLQQVHAEGEKQGFSRKDGLQTDSDQDSFANLAHESLPDQSPSRAPSEWNRSVDHEMDYPENGSEHMSTGHSGTLLSPKEPKGRFYEQYREKRDAKLRDESESRKADKNAKLKSMQEVLECRKAEMAARKGRGTAKANSDGEVRVLAEKLRSPKSDLAKSKKLKDDEGARRLDEIGNQRRERIAARSSPSHSSAGTASTVSTASALRVTVKQPYTPTSQPAIIPTPTVTPKAKPKAARRLSPPKKPSVGTSRGTATSPAAPASAPKLVRRLQTSPQTKEVESPLSRSVPSLAELRKENTKPALVRNSTYNERPRSTGSKLPGMRGAPAPLELNGSLVGPRGAAIDDKKRRVVTKKTGATAETVVPEAPVSGPLKVSKVSPAELSATSNLNKKPTPAPGANVDSKPFLRKGRGIGPGTNVRKSKVAAAPEPSKAYEEEVEKHVSDLEPKFVKTEDGGLDEEDKGITVRSDLTEASEASIEEAAGVSTTRPSAPPQSVALVVDDDDETIRPEEWQEPELADAVCSSEDFLDCKRDQESMHADISPENLHLSTLRPFLSEGLENDSMVNAIPSGTETPPLRSSPIHSIPLRSLSPKGSEVPELFKSPLASSGDAATSPRVTFSSVSDSFPSHDVPSSESAGSLYAVNPAPLPPIQVLLSPEVLTNSRVRKKWLSSQKVSTPSTVKESPRGLKRLLKFGMKKKDKSSAASTTSDSLSDIEDDLDIISEHGGRTEDLPHIGAKNLGSRMPGKASGLVGPPAIPEDSTTEDGVAGTPLVSIPFVRNSVPTAPAHYKTRDEHVAGSGLLKAPRSFFSLSSFRSKVKQ
ncbi:uncharacterized protein [Physcomitrium patens]|uniref:Uncharacterized protein n=1 Tax=Physcomitrium patens TaxID=3218 RepID=A0A2K1IQ66_PHYPA|nr:uncharacterized protein LOC112274034 isoform X3 [Physcomitrium patens]PNR31430.1 hypothetical protein PHYPA_025551 [Physcomitrium patens]|eukprot:XP_024358937.1 uncharacterized protein LOC112274034 isoform X3 [Physcomitrella patens]